MVSGATLFFSLFSNLAMFIALVAVYSSIVAEYEERRTRSHFKALSLGVVFGLFAIGCMSLGIPVAAGVVVDQRNAIVALSGAFGGPLAAIVSGSMAAAYRVVLGGEGVLSGTTGVALGAVAGVALRRYYGPLDSIGRAAFGGLVAALVILPGFLLVGELHEGWALLKRMAAPYGAAIFLGFFLPALLLAREERRQRVERSFRRMVALGPDGIVVLDTRLRVRLFNARAEALSGRRAEDVLGKSLASIEWLTQDSLARLEEAFAAAPTVDDSAAERAAATGLSIELQCTSLVNRVEVTLSKVPHARSGFEWLLAFRDTTERWREQEARAQLEARLNESKSLEALGRLAGGVAHDFNNLLTVILGTVDAYDGAPLDPVMREDLDTIREAGRRAAQLTSQLLAFGRKQVLEPRLRCSAEMLDEVLPLLRRLVPENIALDVVGSAESNYVKVDVAQFEQVIVNLVANARDAMPTGGRLTLGVARSSVEEGDDAVAEGFAPGEYVELSIADTGEGMTTEVCSRIFEPFFTTRGASRGTGLGLATVHGIVKQSGGHIRVETAVGAGTCFRVYLPRHEPPLPSELMQSTPDAVSEVVSGIKVLLVDDNEMVRRPIHRMLTGLGFSVLDASSGEEAIEVFRRAEPPVQLLITDVVMTGVSGTQLVETLMAEDPRVRAVMMSGYAEEAIPADSGRTAGVPLLRKPFSREQLVAALARALVRREVTSSVPAGVATSY